MKKSSLALVSALGGALAAYTGFWFYQSQEIEKVFRKAAEELKQEAAQEKMTLTYNAIHVGGFPLSYSVEVDDLSLLMPDEGTDMQMKAEKLEIITGVFNRGRFDVFLDGDMALATKTEGKSQQYTLHFPASPHLRLELNDMEKLKALHYQDHGYEMRDSNGAVLASSDGTEVKLASTPLPDGQTNFDAFVKSTGSTGNTSVQTGTPFLDKWFSIHRKLGKAAFTLDASFTGPTDLALAPQSKMLLDVRELAMDSDLFDLSLKGSLEKAADASLPIALMTVQLRPVTRFIDALGEAMGTLDAAPVVAGTENAKPSGGMQISEEGKKNLRSLLEQIADKGTLENDGFVATLRSDSAGKVQVGAKSLEETIVLAQKTFAALAVAGTPAAGTPAQGQPMLNDAAPSAGAVPQELPKADVPKVESK